MSNSINEVVDIDDLPDLRNLKVIKADETRKNLKDISFSDIYISETGQAFIKSSTINGPTLSEPPKSVLKDIQELYTEVCTRGQYENEFFTDQAGLRFRIAKLKDVNDIWYVCRRLMWPLPALDKIPGMPRPVVRQLGTLGQPKMEGLILISGATGAGKTTTTFSLMESYLRMYGDVAVTVEDPPELPMSNFYPSRGSWARVFQRAVEGGNFAKAMKGVMRFAPRYIIIGEIRSAAEATTALHAALNGHLILSTIHAKDVTAAMAALVDYAASEMGIDLARSLMSQGLIAVLHQRMENADGAGLRKLDLSYMFLGSDSGSSGDRSKIKAGQFAQLGTTVEMQKNKVERNLLPLSELKFD
jgi:twitching motility protein PilT